VQLSAQLVDSALTTGEAQLVVPHAAPSQLH
jgi:hypothetical protein